ncbi:hypothetical protein G9F72_018850 [Clostridium estertheticum]|uniref:hypothetical protein n=1 Tax=Clostridium estertheticum TaxID=238834 RepID=UPI0013E98AEB|nr:hypothetical protein [Clostridium estertheticum]MBZ9688392.1 hypothetical protein [Clostridium estertheticum]
MAEETKEWLDFIVRLNDRESNKKRGTGITLWALIGVEAVLLIKIIDSLPKIFINNKSIIISLVLITLLLNFSLSLSSIWSFLLSTLSFNKSRNIISTVDKQKNNIMKFYIYVFIILTILINSLVIIYTHKVLWVSPYSYAVSFLIISVMPDLIKFLKSHKKYKSKYIISPNSSFQRLGINVINLLFNAIGFFVLTLFGYMDFNKVYSLLNNIEYLKTSIQIVAFLIILIILTEQYLQSIKYEWLECLERRIFIEKLNADQIKLLFSKEFLGTSVREWFSDIEGSININKQDLEYKMNELSNRDIKIKSKMTKNYSKLKELTSCNKICTDCIITKESNKFQEIIDISKEKIALLKEVELFYNKRVKNVHEFTSQIKLNYEESQYLDITMTSIEVALQKYEEQEQQINKEASITSEKFEQFTAKYHQILGIANKSQI